MIMRIMCYIKMHHSTAVLNGNDVCALFIKRTLHHSFYSFTMTFNAIESLPRSRLYNRAATISHDYVDE